MNFLKFICLSWIHSVIYLNMNTLLIAFTAVLFLSNDLKADQPQDTVLVKVGSKEITIREFIERSELTIRPHNFKSKNITLNNLILEKILALEAETNKDITENELLKENLKGIKEQLMRDKLLQEITSDAVNLDTAELKNAYKASRREYELEFYNLGSEQLANQVKAVIDSASELSTDLFKQLETSVGKKPVRKVKFKGNDDDLIHESLYSIPLDTGTIVGPLKLADGTYIVMKVLNWIDYPIMIGEDEAVRWNEVKQKLQDLKAKKIWLAYQRKLMEGKKIEFDENTFNALADAAYEFYLGKYGKDSVTILMNEIPLPKKNIDPGSTFFSIDNKIWTVDEFKRQLTVHPLVFRVKYLNENNYKKEFRIAVADMIRDYYLTKEAYKDSLDKSVEIEKAVDMWKDSFIAAQEMSRVMNSALEQKTISKDDKPGMLNYKESYMMKLQRKYGSSIKINFKEFEKISLSNIDFLALRSGAPFPLAVPNFPVLSRSEKLDYAESK
jgi:hypothetical protein